MLKHPRAGIIGAGVVLALACACGVDAPDRSGTDTDAAVNDCQALVDGKAYARLIDVKSTSGAAARIWFRTRTESGAYSITRDEALEDNARLTVCLLEAPGLVIPGPPGSETANATEQGAQLAIVILGLNESPVLDAVGPADRLEPLFSQLASAEPSPGST